MKGAIGIKTGFTGKAGYCFVGAVSDENKKFISCALASGWPPNKSYKWSDTKKLMNIGVKKYENKQIYTSVDDLMQIKVENSVIGEVASYTEGDLQMLVSEKDKIEYKTNVGKIEAPVSKGQVLGKVDVIVNDKIICKFDIKSKQSVEEYNYTYCIRKIVQEFLF